MTIVPQSILDTSLENSFVVMYWISLSYTCLPSNLLHIESSQSIFPLARLILWNQTSTFPSKYISTLSIHYIFGTWSTPINLLYFHTTPWDCFQRTSVAQFWDGGDLVKHWHPCEEAENFIFLVLCQSKGSAKFLNHLFHFCPCTSFSKKHWIWLSYWT